MSIRVAINHTTRYEYDRPIAISPQVIRLRPAPHNRTPIHSYSLRIEPEEHFLNWQQDPHGNYLARVVVPERTALFEVKIDIVADLEAFNPFDFFLEPKAEQFPFTYDESLKQELKPYLETEPASPELTAFIETLDRAPRRTVDFLVDINRTLAQAIQYVIRMEPGVQTPQETLKLRRGSCRDSGWLLVQLFRQLGIAARFVSGYLVQLKPDEVPIEGPRGPAEDFTDLHAWCECYVPGAGWIGLDPTSGLLAAEGHIPVACSPQPSSAAPIEGATEKADTNFSFHMDVRRIVDVPRVTKPYSDEQWGKILEVGHEVDARLVAGDVKLTMGGEPTFVSSKEPDAPEWNLAALGGTKHATGDRLLRRLHDLWQPGGLIHHGQGKWYPGEHLPRWATSCYYRHDGVDLWTDDRFAARTGEPLGHTVDDAEAFARRLAENLAVGSKSLMLGYEDTWYYLWRERRLPTNVDPFDSRLEEPVERERLARIFRQGLDAKVGWILPLAHTGTAWISGPWFLREERCYLMPGDSPMGFRLPLDSQPWIASVDYDGGHPPDPTLDYPPLPKEFVFPLSGSAAAASAGAGAARGAPLRQRRFPKTGEPGDTTAGDREAERARERERELRRAGEATTADPFSAPLPWESATGLTRTALCVEPREGILRVFLPPLSTTEAFVELIRAIETTAKELGLPVQVEGYPPPHDPRIGVFKVTPDPGVLEVNLPYVYTWDELVTQTDQLYEAAKREYLAAEKFELDGLHIGSGGGNHLVIGGAHPLDSPFLRRPDVLGSLLRFWHNHPALSYLFSGRFIGPTSQAPRVDEARNDSIYELELALAQLPQAGQQVQPWLVDRILRNLLIDVTGNTHRTEFCIDKLYSPDSATGRLGLVELRSFEMPPHQRMANVQQLLLRALIALFWNESYTTPLARWGTSLHDRYLLPHFVKQDLDDVLLYLRERGIAMEYSWFDPHYQFRFPFYGQIEKNGLVLELRGALEPWHVLGEESISGSGQARFVDSSLEKLQVKVKGMLLERYTVCVNRVKLPLHPTGVQEEAVCGVRYRAWQPPSCLHPNIGIHSPLRFDIYDTWNERPVTGCTYHVVHPGGRANDDRPVNAVAAESRRIARFEHAGHSPFSYRAIELPTPPEFPLTLDLRRLVTL